MFVDDIHRTMFCFTELSRRMDLGIHVTPVALTLGSGESASPEGISGGAVAQVGNGWNRLVRGFPLTLERAFATGLMSHEMSNSQVSAGCLRDG